MANLRVPDLNTLYIAGRLTSDPELKYTPTGKAYCRVRIANTRYFKNQQGERQEDTTFVNASCWDKQAEYIGEKLRKGRRVLVEGSLRSYETEDNGQKTTRIEINARRITPLGWDDQGQQPGATGGQPPQGQAPGGYAPQGGYQNQQQPTYQQPPQQSFAGGTYTEEETLF